MASAYTNDAAVVRIAATLLVIVGVYHVFDALLVVTVSALRGYKRTVMPLAVQCAGALGRGARGRLRDRPHRPRGSRRLGLATPLGVRGFWIAAVLGMLVAAIGILGYYFVVSAPARARRNQGRLEGTTAAG